MERDAIDLKTLNVFKLFSKYFIPTLLGMLGMSAVTAIDGIFVGQGVGSDGIAAVNISIPLLMIFTGTGLMIGVGCSVVASIQSARGKIRTARINVTQALVTVAVFAAVPSLIALLFPDRVLRLLGASPALLPLARDYMLWSVPSWLFTMWVAVSLFVIRLDGRPRLAMACSLISAVINVVLDWIFIFPWGWGVKGAAIATSISVVIGGLIAVGYLLFKARFLRLYPIKWSTKSLRLFVRNIGYQCRIGSSALLAEATLATLMFMGNHLFMRYWGERGVGAFGIACYYTPFVFMVGNAIAQSAQPIISYNFGSGSLHRVRRTFQIALLTAILCGTAVTSLFVFFPQLLVGLFIPSDDPTFVIATTGFPYYAAGFVFFVLNLTTIGYYQSLEQVKPATALALLRGFIFLIPAFLLLPRWIGTLGIWLALSVSELLTALCSLCLYLFRLRCSNH